MTRRSLKAWYLVHKWTSLVCMVFLLMLCVTGLPLIFHHEIDHALGHSVHAPDLASHPDDSLSGASAPRMPQVADPGRIVADAARRRPGEAVQFLIRDPEEPNLWFVRLGERIDAPEASAFFTYDARTGRLLNEYPLNQGVMNVVFRLHYDLFLGLPGTLFLGSMGFVFLLSLLSGLFLYGPYMSKLRFGTVRTTRSRRVRWLDLHNLFGIATLVWLFVVGLTGVINTLAVPIFGHWQGTQLAEMIADTPDALVVRPHALRVGEAVGAAQAAAPELELSFLAFPGTDFSSSGHFVAFMQGRSAWSSKLLTPLLIDARTSRVVDRRQLPWYVTALLISQPLHFGDYGGLPLKILWALLTVAAILVLGSGLYLWLKRHSVSFDSWIAALEEEPQGTVQNGRRLREGIRGP